MLKKISKKKIFISICVMIIIIAGCFSLLGGCGSSSESNMSSEEYMDSKEMADEAAASGASDQETDISLTNQKMITTWIFSVESEDYEDSISELNETVRSLNGYIEYVSESNQNGELRYASYVIRIPDQGEEDWLNKVNSLGTVVSKSKSVENVTLQFIDTESRLNSLKTERDALTKILGSADKVEDIIEVQSQLEEVNYQIESYESQMRTLQNDIDYMTINLDLTEVKRESSKGTGITDEIKERFVNAADGMIGFVRLLFINILGYSLYIILFAAIALTVWRAYRKRKKNHGKNEKDTSE